MAKLCRWRLKNKNKKWGRWVQGCANRVRQVGQMCKCGRVREREGEGDEFSNASHSIWLVSSHWGSGGGNELAVFSVQFQESFPKYQEINKKKQKNFRIGFQTTTSLLSVSDTMVLFWRLDAPELTSKTEQAQNTQLRSNASFSVSHIILLWLSFSSFVVLLFSSLWKPMPILVVFLTSASEGSSASLKWRSWLF